MKKVISPILIIVLLGFISYDHKDQIIENAKYLLNNPAEEVLNANIPENDTVEVFESSDYGKIALLAGTEEDYGLRHILARHTSNYFVNFKNKNNATQFDDDISGKDILKGIDYFLKHCVDVPAYNRERNRNISFIGFTEIGEQRVKCLLIVRRKDHTIVTFYPFVEEVFNRRRRIHYD